MNVRVEYKDMHIHLFT